MNTMITEPVRISLPKDLKEAASTLGQEEARFLVDLYYQMQNNRIRANNQESQLQKSQEPHMTLSWFADQAQTLENQIKRALKSYSEGQEVGEWCMSIYGIGPVITAGLLAHIDIHKAPTVGHIWSFAGLDPNKVWEKGEKRPYNAKLKRLCWILGESFKRFSAQEECVYGHAYRDRKEYEVNRNEAGGNKKTAEEALEKFNIKDKQLLETYNSGKLPAGQLDLRSTRWAVKLFLSHMHHVMYETILNEKPPKPYVIEHLGHVDYVAPPNWPM